MSETASTIIRAALRAIGAIATGETPTYDELNDGLESLKFMLRSWSSRNIMLYYTEDETLTMTGATSYTIGSGGNINTVRPVTIRGAWHTDWPLVMIDEDRYRQCRGTTNSGTVEYLWYNPAYPLGLIYPWPTGGSTVYLDCLKPLTDPATITSSIAFPPEYDDAIKWGLAARLCPEYGKEVTPAIANLAANTLDAICNRNFAYQVNSIRTELIRLASARYNIDQDA